MSLKPAPSVTLLNGVTMPQLGLGTWPMNDAEAATTVEMALKLGYRSLDTAENYANEQGVGAGIRNAKIPREELFVTSKFNKQWHSLDGVRTACEHSLKRLGLDYLDLFLVHWPNPAQNRYVEAFAGLVKLLETGLVRSIGTSNFKPEHLQKLFDLGLTPQVNQIQLDTYRTRADLVAIHQAKGILTETWSPIGRAGALLNDPVIQQLAQNYQRTPVQIVLRWHTQLGYVPVPKSSNPQRLAENLSSFDFDLATTDLQALSQLNRTDAEILDAETFGH